MKIKERALTFFKGEESYAVWAVILLILLADIV